MTVPIVRKRARRPKVRTGCPTCRARHIKCGEEKPTCRNCSISKKECLGYDVVKPPTFLPLLKIAPSCGLSTLPHGIKARDGYALDYFLHRAFQDLPGNSWMLSWEQLVLPFCRSEPQVQYAVMAIGSLQQADLSDRSFHPDQLTTALAQYGRSASMVRTAIEKHEDVEVESILTASLMLFCFEVLNGQDVHAAMHLRSGLKILYEHVGTPTAQMARLSHRRPIEVLISPHSRLELLAHTFVRLDSDLSQLGDNGTFLSPVCRTPLPSALDSLEEAMVHIDVLQSQVCDAYGQLDDLARCELARSYSGFDNLDEDLQSVIIFAASRRVSLSDHAELSARMEETQNAIRKLMAALATIPSSTEHPDTRRMLVKIHLFFVWFDAAVWRDADEMEMDRFDQQFEYILSVCERYFACEKRSPAQTTRPSFVLGTFVGQMVCLIVEKSRNSLLRRRGIKLLSEMDMRGAYDGAFLASVYQHVVETEELQAREMLGLSEGHVFRFNEIPAEARFMEVDVAGIDICDDLYYKKEVGRMVFVRLVDGELKGGDYLFPVMRPFVLDEMGQTGIALTNAV